MNKVIQISTWLSVCLFVAAVACVVAFRVIGSEVDAEGILREPFFLAPLSVLFLLSSLISGAVSIIARIWARYKPTQSS